MPKGIPSAMQPSNAYANHPDSFLSVEGIIRSRREQIAFLRVRLLSFSLVNHTLHRFLHLADGLVLPSLVFKPLIICHDTNCFLDAALDLVTCSTHHIISFSVIDWKSACLLLLCHLPEKGKANWLHHAAPTSSAPAPSFFRYRRRQLGSLLTAVSQGSPKIHSVSESAAHQEKDD